MDAYCSRCQLTAPLASDATAQLGACAVCGGQVSVGAHTLQLGLPQAIAMTFAVGSNVAEPIAWPFRQKPIANGLLARDTRVDIRVDDLDAGEVGPAPDGLEVDVDRDVDVDVSMDVDVDVGVDVDVDVDIETSGGAPASAASASSPPASVPSTDSPPSPFGGAAPADLGGGASSFAAPSFGAPDFGAPDFGAPAGLPGEVAATAGATPAHLAALAPSDNASSAAGSPSIAAAVDTTPAHLQLPSIDFSMPAFGSPDAGASTAPLTPATSTASSSLPAHLQLPSFPQFELPPIPGEAPAAPAAALGASSQAGMPALAGMEPMADPTQAPATRPPPPPRPPPRRARAAEAPPPRVAPKAPSGFDLPSIGLPAIGEPKKKEVTLLASDVAAELAEHTAHKHSVVPFVLLVMVLVAAGVGVWQRQKVIALFDKKDANQQVVETADDKARAAFALGTTAYTGGKLEDAIRHFQAAIALMPNHARAHRALGIVFAKQNKAKEAVEQYRTYLTLDGKAADSAEVRKIVEDYEKAQQAKGGATEPASAGEAAESEAAKAKNGKKKHK